MNLKNPIKVLDLLTELKDSKENIVENIENNIKKRDSMIVDHSTHLDIDRIIFIVQEISKLKNINEHTHKWMENQFSELRRLDFSISNPKEKLNVHKEKLEKIVSFLHKN